MLPLQQAREVRDSVLEYIRATYRFKEKEVSDAFYRFVEDKKDGLFKGPFVGLKTPFVSATEEESRDIPLDIVPSFPPYKHQLQAFRQLSMKDSHKPVPTLLTTGTGSGKTECFLYPVLDYCYHCNQYEHQKGVKVIIMYPMNALASDQAKRLAETIWNDERLKGRVTAGLFVGEGSNPKDHPTTMGKDHIIENRNAILDTVPDILLTNFKMLDYGLMRQRFMSLWKGNIDSEQKALRFVVLDELHTYDGAQGTDVANLLRRLKLKLNLPKEHLCPIGTSATIGNGEDSKVRLCEYASNVFGETFSEEDVVEEHRIAVDDYIDRQIVKLPSGDLVKDCVFGAGDTVESYMRRLCKVWLGKSDATPVEAGATLRKMGIVADMLKALEGGILTLDNVQNLMEDNNKEFRRLRQQYSEKTCQTAIENILALVAYAKRELPSGRRVPMLYLQVQLWQRELSGILRYVQDEPEFVWRGSLKRDDDRVALPMYFCRDCGASGWISRRLATDDRYCSDVKTVNAAFASIDKDVVLLNTETKKHEPVDDYKGENTLNVTHYVGLKDLREMSQSDADVMSLRVCSKQTSNRNGNQRFARVCPECNGNNTICQIGGRTSTLSSVAISQVLSSDFDNASVDKRKMLMFTNSVQDAAHHAGFYEARTYRFLFRQSMQKYINTLSTPVNLVELQKGFRSYWHGRLTDEDYYNRFLPSDLASHVDLSHNYREGEGFMAQFREEFEHRVDWEITSEFGLTAQLGRTLEKTGASATYFKTEQIGRVYELMKPWMDENNMTAEAEDKMRFCHFVYGILQRMRTHGAVDHVYLEKYRREALTLWALNWNRDGRHFLNKTLGGSMQFPELVGTAFTDKNSEMLDMAVLRNDRKQTWYSTYFNDTFNTLTTGNVTLFNDFMRQLMDTMVEAELLNREPQGAGNYAIRPEAIWVSSKVKHVQCENCQSRLCVAQEDEMARGTSCLDYKCRGTYDKETKPELNYYQQVYNRKESPRVNAHEHTGLLDRKDREELERDFKEHPRSNSVNVLTATSTLEMGIDIGDLNVMGNANIPPKPSNFLQRVGRAGRKEGAALVLNYAHAAEPHDMYYFTYPMEMMEGEVTTPGCFLEARDILRRHFLAYCIDTWTSADKTHALPAHISDMKLTDGDAFSSDNFILNQIIGFIKEHKTSLTAAFGSQYGEQTQEALGKLFDTLNDGTFYKRLNNNFATLQGRLFALNEELRKYGKEKDKIQPNDQNMERIVNLIKSTKKQYAQIVDQSVIEYMTNTGLLPNYAFPETGIKLEANVYAKQEKEDAENNKVEPKTFELVRSASQGIRELAPGNYFYTQKQRLRVSGISTVDWKDSLTKMRYCSKCDCVALEGDKGFDRAECPKCSDPSWGNNLHRTLKFTTARSLMYSDDAALDDSSENRDSENYILKRHYMFHHNGEITSYAMKKEGFGIEFCNNMSLYEVNYGMQMQSGEKTDVNTDATVPENGFVVCRYCGKATHLLSLTEKRDNSMPKEEQHYRFCTHRDRSFADDTQGDVFERLYLYRHLQTEAIKILLPVQIMDAASSVEMFKAGIELGMKDYYKSSPEHIRIDSYDEVNMATGKKDHYLVMYDTIPGGTGYLAKLYNTREFNKMLELAYNKIADCECQFEHKDACYHCIMTYGNQYRRESFSREQAEVLFKNLVDKKNTWEMLNGSVGTVSTGGGAEDSELELKFVAALKKLSKQNHWEFEKVPDTDDYKYELHIVDDNTDIAYDVIPQFKLTSSSGVKQYTEADFLFSPRSAKMINSKKVEHVDELPKWAVYLDGYAFHAKAPNIRFQGDKEKRDSIRASQIQLFYTWTLTWKDMQLFEQGKDDALGMNNFTRLIELLKRPLTGYMRETALGCIMDAEGFMAHGGGLYQGELSVDESGYDTLTEASTDEEVAEALAGAVKYDWHLQPIVATSSIDEEEWIGFWRRYNLLQFFPQDDSTEETNALPTEEPAIDRDEVKKLYPEMEDIVDQLLDNGISFSLEGDTEIQDENGLVIAEARMLLRDQKIAIDPQSAKSVEVFHSLGYRTMTSEEFDVNELKMNE